MMNAKKTILTVTMLGILASGMVFAKELPKTVAPLDLTPQQWEQLKDLKPGEQKMAIHKGLKQQMLKEKKAALSEEQKAEVEKFITEGREHRKMMAEKFKSMTPEQKEVIKMETMPFDRHFKNKHHKHDFRGEKHGMKNGMKHWHQTPPMMHREK